MRCPVPVVNERRVLCVFPAYSPSFGTFSHAYPLMGGVKAFMPPQGLLLIAAYMPERWQTRFVDENMAEATDEDFAWADAVFVSGMHIQAPQIRGIHARAKAAGKVTVLGGPSVSGSPEMYPDFDYLHLGEMGDATDRIIAMLDESVAPPPSQVRLETGERLPLPDFPIPAYDQIPLGRYFIGSVQFSSGCPYRCEFCDIPALYGRVARLKPPAQVIAELDAMLKQRSRPAVIYFVDDNFIANKKAARELLPHLVAWQKRHHYPVQFACEATLNIAKLPDLLALMREAQFITVFAGIETPEIEALKRMAKDHNASLPILESIETLNSYGLEVTSGIIMGLDTDTEETEARLIEFVEASKVPVLTLNLLQALPKTPLWHRLEAENRIADDPALESNVRFLRPYDRVVESWRRAVGQVYAPEALFRRFHHQIHHTYRHRITPPARGKLTVSNLRRGGILAFNLFIRVGLLSDYRRAYWMAAWAALKRGQIEAVFGFGLVAHHLITFAREAVAGEQNASFYAAPSAHEAAEERRAA